MMRVCEMSGDGLFTIRLDLGEHKTTDAFKRAMKKNPPKHLTSGAYVCIPDAYFQNGVVITVSTQTVIDFDAHVRADKAGKK